MAAIEFSILDVETTGFFPEKDRIVEIAILRLDAKGKLLRHFSSVVNPGQELGIAKGGRTDEEIQNAPSFEKIAGDIISHIAGTVCVSHNVVFDLMFLKSEFQQLGHSIPNIPKICTLELTRKLVPAPECRRLAEVCVELGIPCDKTQSSLQQAKATRLLFLQGLKLSKIRSLKDMGVTDTPPDISAWPDIAPSQKTTSPPVEEAPQEEVTEVADATPEPVESAPPEPKGPPAMDQYLNLLDDILEDRIVTDEEVQAMKSLAEEHQLQAKDIEKAHRTYLKGLIMVSMNDGNISAGEKKDLDQVRKLLSLSLNDYTSIVEEVRSEKSSGAEPPKFLVSKEDLQGKQVSFLGDPQCKIKGMIPSRMFAESLAGEAGLDVQPYISESLDYLVAFVTEGMEDDMEEARELGVRILAETVFWRMIGVDLQ